MFAVHKNDTQDNACCSAHEAGKKVRELVDYAAHDARDAVAATEREIREHPVRSGAIAAAAGFLIGMLFRRRQ